MRDLTLNQEELEESGIPKAFWKLGVDTYKGNKAALDTANDYVKQSRKMLNTGAKLFCVGPEKSLKTFLLCHMMKSLMVKGYSCIYARFDDAIAMHYNSEDSFAFHRLYGNVDFVAVDNIDWTPRTEAPRVVMTRLIKLRADEGLPLVLASSLLIEEDLEKMYGGEMRDFARYCPTMRTYPEAKEQITFQYDNNGDWR